MATISTDLRERILAAYDRGEGTRDQIARRFSVSLGMVKKLLQQRRRTGNIEPRHSYSGRKPKILGSHRLELRRLLGEKPDLTLEELRAALELDCSLQAIHYALEGLEPPRPFTHDLFLITMGELGASLTQVVVTEMRDRTFFAEIHLDTADGTKVIYTADMQVGGKLAQIGSRLVSGAAKKIADQFFQAFSNELGA